MFHPNHLGLLAPRLCLGSPRLCLHRLVHRRPELLLLLLLVQRRALALFQVGHVRFEPVVGLLQLTGGCLGGGQALLQCLLLGCLRGRVAVFRLELLPQRVQLLL